MSKTTWIWGLAVILVLGLLPSVSTAEEFERGGRLRAFLERRAQASQELGPGESAGSILHRGVERSYLLYTPPSYKDGTPSALVMAFHGGRGQGRNMKSRTRLNAFAEKRGFLVVYPDATGRRNWNDGREGVAAGIDDIGFVRALIDHLQGQRSIDKDRIYATGLSNGAFFTQKLACLMPNQFAAFAPVAATMAKPLYERCDPAGPVSIMMIHGTDDAQVPWEGGEVQIGERGAIVSVQDAITFWARHNGCDLNPRIRSLPDRDPDDGTRVERWEYPNCRDGAEVVLIKVVGGGHTWPGSTRRRFMDRIVGRTSWDINANEVIWEFFRENAEN